MAESKSVALDLYAVRARLEALKNEVRDPFEAVMLRYSDPRSIPRPGYYDRPDLVIAIKDVSADVRALVAEIERLRHIITVTTHWLDDADFTQMPRQLVLDIGRIRDEAPDEWLDEWSKS